MKNPDFVVHLNPENEATTWFVRDSKGWGTCNSVRN